MSEWFFTSDLHGQGALYEQLLALAAAHRPEAVLIGGDLCPHAPGPEGVQQQRVFLQGFLVEFARRLREASGETALVLLMGNDDWAANTDCLVAQDGALWRYVHERAVTVRGSRVAGLSWVPITPFSIKDWERWDDGGDESPARLEGWISRDLGLVRHCFDPTRRAPTIASALDGLAGVTPPSSTIFMLHSPPRDTACDMIGPGLHVGSRAIRAFIERHRPPLTLSGHIHESPRISTSYRDSLGGALVVNPGQFGTSRLCGVWFDPARVAETLRHTVHG